MLSKKSPKSNDLRKSSCGQLDTTGQESQNMTEDESATSSVLVREALALEDLDKNRQLLFTNTVLLSMSQLAASQDPQDKVFRKYKQSLQVAKRDLFEFVKQGDLESTSRLLTTYPIPLTISSTAQKNQSLMDLCISHEHPHILDYLLSHDHSLLNVANSSGLTPVHLAIVGHPSLLRHLISKHSSRIDWRYLDPNRNSYLHYCYFHGVEEEVAEVFRERGVNCPNLNGIIPIQLKNTRGEFGRWRNRDVGKLIIGKMDGEGVGALVTTRRDRPVGRGRKERFSKVWKIPVEDPAIKKQQSGKSTRSSRYTLQSSRFEKYSTLAEFQVVGFLGKGSFADVYKVIHKETKKPYAMKCIHKSRLDHDISHYCYNEKELLAKLDHPCLIKLFCTFQNHNFLFMVMELCESNTLRELIQQPEILPENYVRLLAAELVEAIGYLHEKCVIYRDLKPENTGLGADGHIKLLDLGLAKEGLKANSLCGSHAYLAPEMIKRNQYSFVLDWYTLGIVIYELVMKKTPFAAEDLEDLQQRIIFEQFEPLQCVSFELQDLLSKLLEKNPQQRIGYKRDAEEIREHPWFSYINWERIKKKQYNMQVQGILHQKLDKKYSGIVDQKLFQDRQGHFNKDFAFMEEWESTIKAFS